MKRIIRYTAFVIAVFSLTSCGMFRGATVKENTVATTTEKEIVENVGSNAPFMETTAVTDPIMTETEAVTEPRPAEPDPSVFSALESKLENPPETGAKVSFCYEDLTTGISYLYNGDTIMWSASVMKLPIVMSILYKAETQDMGLDDIYVYSESDYREGTGEIINKPVGTSYTYIDLIGYMLKYSDNVAFTQVCRKYGQFDHYDYVRSIGADSFTENTGWRSTAADCAILLRSTYEYLEGDYLYSERIKNDMINSFHTVMLSPGLSGKPIARKYGWDEEGYNDVGIVYDEHPYVLVFMSNMTSGSGAVNGYISGIAAEADRVHEEIWGTVQ